MLPDWCNFSAPIVELLFRFDGIVGDFLILNTVCSQFNPWKDDISLPFQSWLYRTANVISHPAGVMKPI